MTAVGNVSGGGAKPGDGKGHSIVNVL